MQWYSEKIMSHNSRSSQIASTQGMIDTLAYYIVSLGCPKNLVDTEQMMAKLAMSGMVYTPDPEEAQILLVNTCGFIDAAKLESIEAMQEICSQAQPNQRVIVTGCLVQRYPQELTKQFPEVDAFLSLRDQSEISRIAWRLMGRQPEAIERSSTLFTPRLLTTPSHMAYLRISDGCFHQCSFCAIPSFRGTLRSRTIEENVAEARALVQGGAKELVLISQDSTSYGYDIYGRFRLVELLNELEQIDEMLWMRLMYSYPTLVDKRLIQFLKHSKKLARYIDMPIQHGSAEILKAMRRGSRPDHIRRVVENLREACPGISIRSTVIAGFPGEEESHFEEMMELLNELQFDNLGVFKYSDEDGTPAAKLPNKVPEEIRDERYNRLVKWAAQNARERNQRWIGRMVDVLVDRIDPYDGLPWGRHEGQAPECDGQVCITRGSAQPGELIKVRITDVDEENFYGTRHNPPSGRT